MKAAFVKMENIYIQRPQYMEKLHAFRSKDLIKIITGVRRCGKSTLLTLFQKELTEQGVTTEQIVALNLEDYDLYMLRQPAELHRCVTAHLVPGCMTYVFIDEVQRCMDFADVLNSLRLRPNIDLYVTGSNASLLSSDLATYIAGRYIEIPMLPFSFREFVTAVHGEDNLTKSYSRYIENSSFPYALQFDGKHHELRGYLESLYDTIVVRDILQRRRFADPLIMESILRFVFDSIGNRLSMRKIADTLTSAGRRTDVKTVERYMHTFEESYLVYRARRFDVRGGEELRTQEKLYAVDTGLRRMLAGPRAADASSTLENVIYLELVRRGREVYTGKWKDREIDFVTREPGALQYYQVAATVRDPAVLKRELAPLQAVGDNYPKTLLTLDEDPEDNYKGIKKVNALKWLMGTAEV